MSKHKPGQIVLKTNLDDETYMARLTSAINMIQAVVGPAAQKQTRETADKQRRTRLGNSSNG